MNTNKIKTTLLASLIVMIVSLGLAANTLGGEETFVTASLPGFTDLGGEETLITQPLPDMREGGQGSFILDGKTMGWESGGDVDGFIIESNSSGSFSEMKEVSYNATNGQNSFVSATPVSGEYVCYRVKSYVMDAGDKIESSPTGKICNQW